MRTETIQDFGGYPFVKIDKNEFTMHMSTMPATIIKTMLLAMCQNGEKSFPKQRERTCSNRSPQTQHGSNLLPYREQGISFLSFYFTPLSLREAEFLSLSVMETETAQNFRRCSLVKIGKKPTYMESGNAVKQV